MSPRLTQRARDFLAILDHLERGGRHWGGQYRTAIMRAPLERQDVIVGAIGVVVPALAHLSPGDRVGLAEALPEPYRQIEDLEVCARLVLGEKPTEIAKGLSRREAHRWLCSGARFAPAEWYLREHLPPAPLFPACSMAVVAHRSVKLARWIVDVYRDPPRREALLRLRREILAGAAVEGRYVDRLDELRDSDLKPSVEATFAAAARRMIRRLERSLRSRGGAALHAPPAWWRPVRCARLLHTGPDLIAEGRAMQHCVAGYAGAVAAGESIIVGIVVCGQRSTVEIRPGRAGTLPSVVQHRGLANSAPPELCRRALAVCCARWGVAYTAGSAVDMD